MAFIQKTPQLRPEFAVTNVTAAVRVLGAKNWRTFQDRVRQSSCKPPKSPILTSFGFFGPTSPLPPPPCARRLFTDSKGPRPPAPYGNSRSTSASRVGFCTRRPSMISVGWGSGQAAARRIQLGITRTFFSHFQDRYGAEGKCASFCQRFFICTHQLKNPVVFFSLKILKIIRILFGDRCQFFIGQNKLIVEKSKV